MQPYYEARGLPRTELGGRDVPPMVTQIGDGENGGVMMNEFPPKFMRGHAGGVGVGHAALCTSPSTWSTSRPPASRTTISPPSGPLVQKRIWDRFGHGGGPDAMAEVIDGLRREDPAFHVEGGSWTGGRSWVRGYGGVLGPMEAASRLFDERIVRGGVPESDPHHRAALFHLLACQTSCFRYWGEGRWADYGRELCRRAAEATNS